MEALRVQTSPDGCHVVAARAVPEGETLCRIEGEVRATPSRHSLQVGVDRHVLADDTTAWRYTNHSCDPNAALRGEALVALRPIVEGEEITFDYETTEVDMAEPFDCRCAAPTCRGVIRGFRHTTPAVRERLRPLLAPHLRDEEPGGDAPA